MNDRSSPVTRGSLAWHACVVGVIAAALVVSAVATAAGSNLGYDLIVLSLPVVVLTGVRRHARDRFWTWLGLAVGLGFYGLADVLWNLVETLTGEPISSATPIDALYLFGYIGLGVALHRMVRRVAGDHHSRTILLDTAIVAFAGIALIYVAILHPTLNDSTSTILTRLVAAAYPVMDVFLLAVAVRLTLTVDERGAAFWYLNTGLAVMLAADIGYAANTVHGWTLSLSALDVAWLGSYCLIAASALHPSMRGLTAPRTREELPLSTPRIMLFGMALLVPPVLLLQDASDRGNVDMTIASACSFVIVILVLMRLVELLRFVRSDIDYRRQTAETMRRQALHDALTGLPNRLLFVDRLEHALRRAERSSDPVAVLFLDLDHFKVVNDGLGHDVGDDLLVEIARRLEDGVRPGDTVARFGGDEFTILLESVDDLAEAREVAERILTGLSVGVEIDGRRLTTGGSIGIALSTPGTSADELLRDADAAMYRAKERGRNLVVPFDEAIRSSVHARLTVETALRHAVARDELRLHYQPIIELATRSIVGVEALLRWQHPELGEIPPGHFIQIAEETGMIDDIGAWVIREACRQSAVWAGEGHPLTVSVNLAPRQFSRRGTETIIAAALGDHRVDPSRLVIEITERTVMEQCFNAEVALRRLTDLGVDIWLDDFGTGYSSLAYLQRLPVAGVKIDRSFVTELGQSQRGDALVSAIVSIARALDLTTTVEGVEMAEQLVAATRLGCDRAQGFHIAKAITAEELAAMLPPTIVSSRHVRPAS